MPRWAVGLSRPGLDLDLESESWVHLSYDLGSITFLLFHSFEDGEPPHFSFSPRSAQQQRGASSGGLLTARKGFILNLWHSLHSAHYKQCLFLYKCGFYTIKSSRKSDALGSGHHLSSGFVASPILPPTPPPAMADPQSPSHKHFSAAPPGLGQTQGTLAAASFLPRGPLSPRPLSPS